MRLNFGKLSMVIFLFVSIIACNDNTIDDSQNPTIDNFTIASDSIHIGDFLFFSATFADDVELTTYKVEITADFELNKQDSIKFETLDLVHVSGFYLGQKQHAEITDTITIPVQTKRKGESQNFDVAPGNYSMNLSCMDIVGKKVTVRKPIVLLEEREDD